MGNGFGSMVSAWQRPFATQVVASRHMTREHAAKSGSGDSTDLPERNVNVALREINHAWLCQPLAVILKGAARSPWGTNPTRNGSGYRRAPAVPASGNDCSYREPPSGPPVTVSFTSSSSSG